MRFAAYTKAILGVAETVFQWLGALSALDRARRRRVAGYAEAIADTLARTIASLDDLADVGCDRKARRSAVREAARIRGYLETMVDVLDRHLDGRKLAGVKRRLEHLHADVPLADLTTHGADMRLDRLAAAEGYFRALADGLRT